MLMVFKKPLLRVIYISLSLHIVNSVIYSKLRRVHPIESSVMDDTTLSSEVGTKLKTQHLPLKTGT